jgi:hypothetical protein
MATPKPLSLGGSPVRECVVDGETLYWLAPWVLAIVDELRAEGVEEPSRADTFERLRLYQTFVREPDDELFERMASHDAQQREHGYEGP